MKINQLLENKKFKLLNDVPYLDEEIIYIYSCDLLSLIMAKGEKEDAWITVQTHSNIVAIASLLEMSCIILPESIKPEETTLIKATENDIPIISTPFDVYKIMKEFPF
ncbi:MAG: AraC family transcriptional regulator [Clostridiales bacterium]|nr:AraC family transcriptional regulator [Clostridiales bacterium]